ncbi:hypothetical protein HKX48_007743 [Thoreauomyces humboldtii]|nr:hypothetical protein HKX48_007743 [Thoreauomyces humboldtii]
MDFRSNSNPAAQSRKKKQMEAEERAMAKEKKAAKKPVKKALLVDTASKRFQSTPAHERALKEKMDKINGVEKPVQDIEDPQPLSLPPAALPPVELTLVPDFTFPTVTTASTARDALQKCVEVSQRASPGVSDDGKLSHSLQEIFTLYQMRMPDIHAHVPKPRTEVADPVDDMASPTTAYLSPTPVASVVVPATPVGQTLKTFQEAVGTLAVKLHQYNTHAFPLRKKKKIWSLFADVERTWRDLMIQLTFAVARDSSDAATTASGNVAKLAVATGAPDWQDLTIDDAAKLFIQGDKYLLGFGVTRSYDIAYKRYLVSGMRGSQTASSLALANPTSILKAAAKLGSVEATNMLGVMFENGLGRAPDMAAAIRWYQDSANRSHAESLSHMARIHLLGKGVPTDPATAQSLFLLAAQQNHLPSMVSLGSLLEPTHPTEAIHWYTLAASQDFAKGQNALGSCYYRGVGVERNHGEAVTWLRKAAEQGDANALNNLGICYEEGLGVARDLGVAKGWYKLAAEQRHGSGVNNWGFLCLVEKNYAEAIQHFHLAMALDSVDAAYNLGTLYETGCHDVEGVVLNRDLDVAMRYYKQAAKKNYTKALLRLSTIHTTSLPPHQSFPLARHYLLIAAEPPSDPSSTTPSPAQQGSQDGSADAQNMLGEMTELGLGGPEDGPDHAGAAKWYRRAMRQGHPRAICNLAALYEGGLGVGVDVEKALRLYKEAEQRGSKDAKARYDALNELGIVPRRRARDN